MNDKELTTREIDTIYKTFDVLADYVVEMKEAKGKDKNISKAYSHIEKACEILQDFSFAHVAVMYGPPEAIYSPKELSELRFRDETRRMVTKTQLSSDQWQSIVSELVSSDVCDCKQIQDLINEKLLER